MAVYSLFSHRETEPQKTVILQGEGGGFGLTASPGNFEECKFSDHTPDLPGQKHWGGASSLHLNKPPGDSSAH